MQELNINEIDEVNGAGKFGVSVLGVTAGFELTQDGLTLSADVLGFPLFGLQLPL